MTIPTQRRFKTGTGQKRTLASGPSPSEAAAVIRSRLGHDARIAVVLGSGFGQFRLDANVTGDLEAAEVPGFRSGSVSGHSGRVFKAVIGAIPVIGYAGRTHFYEGFSMEEITFPVRVLAALGVETLLLTNAAGGIHPKLRPGDFMVIRDHINFMGANPLRGFCQAGSERFVDFTTVYDLELRKALRAASRAVDRGGREGVYLAVSGPSYETPAEILAFQRLGADAVGMSTVPEAIVARQCGLRVAGLSLISNRAAGLSGNELTHQEVIACGRSAAEPAAQIIREFVRRVGP
jgi:purine-nucleoside phosphorylase